MTESSRAGPAGAGGSVPVSRVPCPLLGMALAAAAASAPARILCPGWVPDTFPAQLRVPTAPLPPNPHSEGHKALERGEWGSGHP